MSLRDSSYVVPLLFTALLACGSASRNCSDVWSKRPAWADSYYSSIHASSDQTCAVNADCNPSLHFCVQGRCRAFCPKRAGATNCPSSETCVSEFRGATYQYPQGYCGDFTGQSTADELRNIGTEGGVCVLTSEL